jgi:hypothetical protein
VFLIDSKISFTIIFDVAFHFNIIHTVTLTTACATVHIVSCILFFCRARTIGGITFRAILTIFRIAGPGWLEFTFRFTFSVTAGIVFVKAKTVIILTFAVKTVLATRTIRNSIHTYAGITALAAKTVTIIIKTVAGSTGFAAGTIKVIIFA